MAQHLLNLRVLADATIDDYALLGFQGFEAISQPFSYRLELITTADDDLSKWIGKLAEFDVSPHTGTQRVFSGRIYAARRMASDGQTRVFVELRPAYYALAFAKATHFVQDKSSTDIFEVLTAEVPGLVKTVNVTPAPAKRGYSVRYDESEIDYLARLLAQDGIMYFFAYDRGAGAYRHKMIVTNGTSNYIDIAAGPVEFLPNSAAGAIDLLEHHYNAAPRKQKHVSFNVNKLDTPFVKETSASDSWGAVYSHPHETIGFEALAEGDLGSRQAATDQGLMQSADLIEGRSTEASFLAGGRVEIIGGAPTAPKRIVLTAVTHSAYDPWMLQGSATASYSNSFTALEAGKTFRPPVDQPQRKAPGPLLGVIATDGAAVGEIKVDKQWRVPVAISNARDYSGQGLEKYVWLPVQQQWAHSTHGAQFLPRIGTRVIIDFLYGNPDLPFISGTVYTPSQPYPFDPTSKATQSGWRSVTDKNGSIVQEFHFEDKPGAEEIYLYTGRDYRRMIDQDDWGTVKRDQTLDVQRDQTLTVKRDRTITVTGKNLLESKKEIEIKVGPSTIKLTMQGIEIKAPKIDIKGDATVKVGAPKVDVVADAMLTLQGGIVKIN